MSTAVMHQAAMYDFGDVLLKSQAVAARNTISQINNNGTVATQQLLQQALAGTNISNNTHNNFNNSSTLQQQQMNNPKLIRWEQTKMSMNSSPPPTITPSQLHQVLFRTNSSPVISMTSLMNSLMETYEHRKLERSRSDPMPHMKVSAQAQAALAAQINTSRYKTELCRPYEEAGTCKYGDKCQFAHGILELRNLQRHPKYKTELCRTFHSVGFCPYGPRCHFIHNAEEAKEHNRTVKAYLDAQQAQKAARLAQDSQHRPTPLSLSPAFSMSTSSDLTTPLDSNSPSPSSPMVPFFGMDQDQHHLHQPLEIQSPTLNGINFPSSPTYSTAGNATCFPYNGEYTQSTCSNASNSSPPTSPPIVNGAESAVNSNANGNGIVEESRLPVFNRLSSVFGVENLKKI